MRLWFLLVLAVCVPAAAQQTAEKETVTLEEAVRLAIDRHPDVGKARAASDVLKGKIREVRAQALPDVRIIADGARARDPGLLNSSGIDQFPVELRNALSPIPVNLFDYSINVKQPLYTAGKVGTALRLASVEAEGALVDVDRAEQDLALEVVKAYYGLLWAERDRELVAATQEQRKLHAEMARTRFKNGVATEVDVLRSEVAVANGAPELVRADNAIRQARALLNFYMVRPIDFPTRTTAEFPEKPWEEASVDALFQEAARGRPELHRLRIAEQSAAAQFQLARAENRMRVDGSAGYGIVSRLPKNLMDSLYSRWSVGVSFTLPVFDGFKRSGLMAQAAANQRVARLERERVEQQVRLGLQQGGDDLKAARETIIAARTNIGQAERVLSMMQDNYRFGAATTLDIVDAQTVVTVARTNLLSGLHDYAIARANLLWTMGKRPWE
jgi:outer membrane protein TolC